MVFGDAWMVCKGCLGMYQYQIHLRKVILGHTLPLLQTHSCPLMRKSTFVWRYMDGVWGCLGMTWCCLEVSGWCVGVSGDVSVPNPFAKDYVSSDIVFSSNALVCVKLPMSGGVLMVSGWCLGVSGWSHSDYGCCQLGTYVKTSNTSSIGVTVLSYCIFFQWPS